MTQKARRWLQSGFDLNRCDDEAKHSLGDLAMSDNGKIFRYVQFLDAVTYVAGHVCTWAGATAGEYKVSNDRASGTALALHPVAGILSNDVRVPTQNQFGWIQVAGESVCTGTYAVGNQLKPHASTDGAAVVSGYTAAAVDFNIFARAKSDALVQLQGLV